MLTGLSNVDVEEVGGSSYGGVDSTSEFLVVCGQRETNILGLWYM